MSLVLSVLSTEYVRVQVGATKAGAVYNPTSDVVSLAFPAAGSIPAPSDWLVGAWETTIDNQYLAKLLVGPSGALSLPVGDYDIWVKIVDSPEIPVIRAGQLLIQ